MRKSAPKKAKVSETIADRSSTNIRIERSLKKRSIEEQMRILDALEIVKDRGAAGITVSEWAFLVRSLHPEEDYSMKDLLKMVVLDFNFCVRRIADKTYGWDESDRDLATITPQIRAAVGNQIQLTSLMMQMMKEMREFSRDGLAHRLANMTGMPLETAGQFADHVIRQFVGGFLTSIGFDSYRVTQEFKPTTSDSVDMLKNLASNPSKGGGNPPSTV